MPGRGAVSWSWRRAISGMGSSRKSGPLISGSKTKAPGSPRRLSVATSDDKPAPRRIARAVWTHLGTGLDTALIVHLSDSAAPSRSAVRTPWAVRLTPNPKVPSGISSRSACLTTSEASTSLGTVVNRSRMEPTGSDTGQTALALITELTEPVGITPRKSKPVPSSRCLNCSSVRSAPPATISMFRSSRPPEPVMPSSTISTT